MISYSLIDEVVNIATLKMLEKRLEEDKSLPEEVNNSYNDLKRKYDTAEKMAVVITDLYSALLEEEK